MSIREDYEYIKESKAARESIKENAEVQRRKEFNDLEIAREDAIMAHEHALDKFYAYKDDVKKTLLKEALIHLYEGSFFTMSKREHVLCENLLDQYINEVGTEKLLKNMKYSDSELLHDIYEQTNVYYKKITEDATADDEETQTIKDEDIAEFWDQLEKANDVEDVTNLIRMRVSNAEENFVNKNHEDKEDVKTILQQTADRIQNAKTANDNDYAEAVEESETRLAKSEIYKIQHEGYHNVFDRMVRNLSEVAMTNEQAKAEFTENGKLNVEKIVESARCMYTLLEMVGTIELENVDGQYIEDTLKSIK